MAATHSAGIAVVSLDNAAGTPVDVTGYIQGLPSMEVGYETADATVLSDLARSFVFGLEDGGEIQVTFLLDDATPSAVWTLLTGLRRLFGTLTVGPLGGATNQPKIEREVGITKLGTPVTIDGVAQVVATLKANGATTTGVYA